MSITDSVSVLSGDRSRIFTGFGTCKSPFLLFLLLRLRDAEVGDRNFDEPAEVRGIRSEPFDDDNDESGVVGESGVVDRLLHREPGIKSCSSN